MMLQQRRFVSPGLISYKINPLMGETKPKEPPDPLKIVISESLRFSENSLILRDSR